MNSVWLYSILSVVLISLISLVGVFTFSIKSNFLKRIIILLVSFSAGSLFGNAFLHLIPEAMPFFKSIREVSIMVLAGIMIFFVLEKVVHWRHCHIPTSEHHIHPFAIMNLIGDGLHNLIDGLIIGASYLISIPLGIATTTAVILHEIPQEISDFGVLIHGGFDKTKALMLNLLSGMMSIVGVVIVLIIGARAGEIAGLLLPLAAGGFIYIAGSDLIPEIHKECEAKKSLAQLASFFLGIVLMFLLV